MKKVLLFILLVSVSLLAMAKDGNGLFPLSSSGFLRGIIGVAFGFSLGKIRTIIFQLSLLIPQLKPFANRIQKLQILKLAKNREARFLAENKDLDFTIEFKDEK